MNSIRVKTFLWFSKRIDIKLIGIFQGEILFIPHIGENYFLGDKRIKSIGDNLELEIAFFRLTGILSNGQVEMRL